MEVEVDGSRGSAGLRLVVPPAARTWDPGPQLFDLQPSSQTAHGAMRPSAGLLPLLLLLWPPARAMHRDERRQLREEHVGRPYSPEGGMNKAEFEQVCRDEPRGTANRLYHALKW